MKAGQKVYRILPRRFQARPIVPGTFRRARWILSCVILSLLASTLLNAVRAAEAMVAYTNVVELEWGMVEAPDPNDSIEGWYTRTAPSFANGNALSPQEQDCLKQALPICLGNVGGQQVWRMDDGTLGRFKDRVNDELRCVLLRRRPTPPPDWTSGPKRKSWEFTLRLERTSVTNPPPRLELALLIEEVPPGTAWRVPIPDLTRQIEALHRAGLSPAEAAGLTNLDSWVDVFLLAPDSLRQGAFPNVVSIPDLSTYATPLACGLRCLAKIQGILGPDRKFSEAASSKLQAAFSLDGTNDIHAWFPESYQAQAALRSAALGAIEIATGTSPPELFKLGMPDPAGQLAAPRVLPEANEWAIRLGPFRRVAPPLIKVGWVRGKTNDIPVEKLSTNGPTSEQKALEAVPKAEARLQDALTGYPLGADEFFWLPALEQPFSRGLRAAERTRYVGGLKPAFRSLPGPPDQRVRTNRFEYLSTYAPPEIRVKVSAEYEPEPGFGGGGEIGISDFPRPGDRLNVQANIAERVLAGGLSYRFPYWRSLDSRSRLALELVGDAGRNDHFRLGSLSPKPFEHEWISGGLQHTFTKDWDRVSYREEDRFVWDSHQLSQPGVSGTVSDEGLLFQHRQFWHFAPGRTTDEQQDAVPTWDYFARPILTLAPAVGWDDAFWGADLELESRYNFGGSNQNAMYVALRAGWGMVSDEAPPPFLERMGETERMYGIEPGEFSGRSYAHVELSYGLRIAWLLRRLFVDKQGNDNTPGILDDAFIRPIAEFGTIASQDGFGSFTDADDNLSSYGIALEKKGSDDAKGPSFRLGYAWSPDSVRTKGRVFTSLSFAF